eukprot:TRINITY_DN7492_c0_g2_i2.p1 TRINITY_DN7492_c0_g2~~TRINITY_DN7492_c0_g2_i2.p1  ORF type:complete len:660 (+),score=123.06 TRINITY_DN7492_c0_g2_i2:90-2069(+)
MSLTDQCFDSTEEMPLTHFDETEESSSYSEEQYRKMQKGGGGNKKRKYEQTRNVNLRAPNVSRLEGLNSTQGSSTPPNSSPLCSSFQSLSVNDTSSIESSPSSPFNSPSLYIETKRTRFQDEIETFTNPRRFGTLLGERSNFLESSININSLNNITTPPNDSTEDIEYTSSNMKSQTELPTHYSRRFSLDLENASKRVQKLSLNSSSSSSSSSFEDLESESFETPHPSTTTSRRSTISEADINFIINQASNSVFSKRRKSVDFGYLSQADDDHDDDNDQFYRPLCRSTDSCRSSLSSSQNLFLNNNMLSQTNLDDSDSEASIPYKDVLIHFTNRKFYDMFVRDESQCHISPGHFGGGFKDSNTTPKHHTFDVILEDELGKGQFADVYKAQIGTCPIPVAIKIMRSGRKGFIHSFLREVNILKTINSIPSLTNSVVQLIGYVQDADRDYYWIITELVSGQSLKSVVKSLGRGVSIGVDWVIYVGLQIARTMLLMSQSSSPHILHRDLTNDNIMWDSLNCRIKILDFGVAEISSASSSISANCQTGHPRYCAPEGAQDVQSEIFSFGCCMYELLTGREPLEGIADHWAAEAWRAGKRPGWVNCWEEEALSSEEVAKRRGMRRLVESCWNEDRTKRPNGWVVILKCLEMISPGSFCSLSGCV